MDIQALAWYPSQVAASAVLTVMLLTKPQADATIVGLVERFSGYSLGQLRGCVRWIESSSRGFPASGKRRTALDALSHEVWQRAPFNVGCVHPYFVRMWSFAPAPALDALDAACPPEFCSPLLS